MVFGDPTKGLNISCKFNSRWVRIMLTLAIIVIPARYGSLMDLLIQEGRVVIDILISIERVTASCLIRDNSGVLCNSNSFSSGF